jgi:hypothetical protein
MRPGAAGSISEIPVTSLTCAAFRLRIPWGKDFEK